MKRTTGVLIAGFGFVLAAACNSGDDDTGGVGMGGAGGSTGVAGKGGTGASAGKGSAGDASDAGGAGSPATGGSLCDQGCAETLKADCPNGPQSQADCVTTCEALESGSCASEYSAFQTCAEGHPITCDATSGIPVVAACESEQGAFIACLAQ